MRQNKRMVKNLPDCDLDLWNDLVNVTLVFVGGMFRAPFCTVLHVVFFFSSLRGQTVTESKTSALWKTERAWGALWPGIACSAHNPHAFTNSLAMPPSPSFFLYSLRCFGFFLECLSLHIRSHYLRTLPSANPSPSFCIILTPFFIIWRHFLFFLTLSLPSSYAIDW